MKILIPFFVCMTFLVPMTACNKSHSKETKGETSSDPVDLDPSGPTDVTNTNTDPISVGTLAFSVGAESVGALPSLSGAQLTAAGVSEGQQQAGTLAISLPLFLAASEALSDRQVATFFKLECHWAETDSAENNFCPENIKAKLIGMKKDDLYNTGFKLTSYTLLGIIEHASMYLRNSYKFRDSTNDGPLLDQSSLISSFTYKSTTGQKKNRTSPAMRTSIRLRFLDSTTI